MERKRLIQEGLAKRAFPPQVVYPELKQHWDQLSPVVGPFEYPVMVWVPEAVCHQQKPQCVVEGCSCTPRVKEYRNRVVDDIDGRLDLLYIKYQCAGNSRTCFSTISPEYLKSNVEAIMHFSFILGAKTGYSRALLKFVHDGMMSPNGLSNTIANVRRRRQNRYYKLYTLSADRARRLRASNPDYMAPILPTVTDYCSQHAVVDSKVLTTAWMKATSMYGSLCELRMQNLTVRKVLRVDHSAKFCKKLKLWEGSGQRTSISDAKLLLLVQNEIGQIVGRRLAKSENNVETAALLETIKPTLKPADDRPVYLVSDNVNSVRGMVHRTFGSGVHVEQDPCHVMMLVKREANMRSEKEVDFEAVDERHVHCGAQIGPPPLELEAAFRRVTKLVSLSDISCSESIWHGCIDIHAAQIQSGDLFVENNDYAEGHLTTRIVATSQLEGFHSGLRKLLNRSLSVEVGLRILDVYIVQHNLRVGAEFGRNAFFGDINFVTLAQAAMLNQGSLVDSPQLAFVKHILSGQIEHPQNRSASSLDFDFLKWLRMFECARVVPESVEAALDRPRRHWSTIRELLLLNAISTKSHRLSRAQFMSLLRLEPYDSESSFGFTMEEYELLRQIRKRASPRWAHMVFVSTGDDTHDV